jgi:hypothetical protein
MLATFLMGTSVHNSPSENLRLMYLMMQEFDRLARQHGFKMSISHNVSPITQVSSKPFIKFPSNLTKLQKFTLALLQWWREISSILRNHESYFLLTQSRGKSERKL